MHKRLSDVLSHVLTCSLVLTLAMPAPGMAEELVEQSTAEETPEVVEGDVPEGEAAESEAQTETPEGTEQQDEATDEGTSEEVADDGLEVVDDASSDEPAVLDGAAEAATEDASDKAKVEEATPKVEEKKDTKKTQTLLTAQSSTTPTKEADSLASKHANTLPNGTYGFMNTYAGKFLDMKYATKADGGAAIIWNQKNVSNQRWVITGAGGGYVTIKSESSGKYLQAGYKNNDTAVVQMSRNSSNRGQLWIVCCESGTYKFVSGKNTNCSLSVYGGSVVCSPDERGGNANTRWRVRINAASLNSLAKAHRGDLVNGTYVFKNAAKSSLALDVRYSSHDNAANVLLRGKEGTTSQSWTVSHDSNGYVILVNANSGRALDVKYGTAVAGTQLIQWTKKEGTPRNQRWVAIKQGSAYTFISAMDGDVLGMGPKSTSDGSYLQLVQKTNATNQQWSIEKAPSSYAKVQHIADGQYVMRSALDTGKTLDVLRSSVEPNANVKLWTLKCSDNQIWIATHDSYGHVYLRNKHSGLYLAYRNNRLVQSPYGSAWIFEKVSGSTYYVKDADTGKCLDVKQNNTNLSTNEIILWGKKGGKNQQWWMSTPTIGIDTQIMGTAQVSQEAAVRYVNKRLKQLGNKSLPAKWRNDGETVAKIVKYFYEEGAAEGVRGDVALAQSIHETACFQFGGDVIPSQYNFAGIGTTGGGVKGNYFANARVGVRAQIQHLKAYASTLPLNRTCVDPRFRLVTRGRAPTIRGLSGTWAIDSSYAKSLVNYLNEMLKS